MISSIIDDFKSISGAPLKVLSTHEIRAIKNIMIIENVLAEDYIEMLTVW
jgi:hypothetical protein